jgi:hypothetical protein
MCVCVPHSALVESLRDKASKFKSKEVGCRRAWAPAPALRAREQLCPSERAACTAPPLPFHMVTCPLRCATGSGCMCVCMKGEVAPHRPLRVCAACLAMPSLLAQHPTTASALSRGAMLLRRGFELRLAGDAAAAVAFYSRALEAEPTLLDVRGRSLCNGFSLLFVCVCVCSLHRRFCIVWCVLCAVCCESNVVCCVLRMSCAVCCEYCVLCAVRCAVCGLWCAARCVLSLTCLRCQLLTPAERCDVARASTCGV